MTCVPVACTIAAEGSLRIYTYACMCVCVFVCLCMNLCLCMCQCITAGWECRECSDPTPRPAGPAHSGGTLMGSDGGAGWGWWWWWWWGSDSSVTLTRTCRPLSQSGIAHPQCQKGEFIFLAPALPYAGYRGPPRAGSPPPPLCPEPPLPRADGDLLGRGGMKEKKNACDLHLT